MYLLSCLLFFTSNLKKKKKRKIPPQFNYLMSQNPFLQGTAKNDSASLPQRRSSTTYTRSSVDEGFTPQ